jgi:hypothetical protein
VSDLVPAEKARLAELEAVVDRGLQTFYEVGNALLEIRERKLYRETNSTFQAYCQERFGFSDSRGRQLIAAAKTVTTVTAQGLPAPKTEREARELARQLRAQADALDGGEKAAWLEHLRAASEHIRLGDELIEQAKEELARAREAIERDGDMSEEDWRRIDELNSELDRWNDNAPAAPFGH